MLPGSLTPVTDRMYRHHQSDDAGFIIVVILVADLISTSLVLSASLVPVPPFLALPPDGVDGYTDECTTARAKVFFFFRN